MRKIIFKRKCEDGSVCFEDSFKSSNQFHIQNNIEYSIPFKIKASLAE